jgi:uncharacterized protein
MQIFITVKFEKRKEKVQKEDDKYFVYIKSLPQKGEANKEVVKEIAKYFKVKEEGVKIVKGLKSYKKTIIIKED